jgi:hypothetical protein
MTVNPTAHLELGGLSIGETGSSEGVMTNDGLIGVSDRVVIGKSGKGTYRFGSGTPVMNFQRLHIGGERALATAAWSAIPMPQRSPRLALNAPPGLPDFIIVGDQGRGELSLDTQFITPNYGHDHHRRWDRVAARHRQDQARRCPRQ